MHSDSNHPHGATPALGAPVDRPPVAREPAPGRQWTHVMLALAAAHVFAITIAALPPACDARGDGSDEAESAEAVVLSAGVAGAVLRTCQATVSAVRPALRPVERLTGRYVRATGLRQQWDMFSRPPRRNDFVHLRYYVQAAHVLRPTRVERESVYPASSDGWRLPAGRYFEEKAIRNARQRMLRRIREKGTIRTRADLPRELRPLLQFYAARFRGRLAAGEQLVRTEVWLGSSPIAGPAAGALAAAAPGDGSASSAGEAQGSAPARSGPRVGTSEQEGAIRWTLYDILVEEGR